MIRLVVVDDSPLMLKMAEKLVKDHIGGSDLEVHLIDDGHKAIDFLMTNDVDILLLDIIMPNIGGLEIMETLIASNLIENMKVIMFSSLSDTAYLKTFFELGAFDYITKPIHEDEFIARMKNAIHQQVLQRQLKEQIELIKHQNASLEELNTKLKTTHMLMIQQDQLAGIGHLAAGVAHEINNPLGFITSNYSTLKDYIVRLKRFFDTVDSSAKLWDEGKSFSAREITQWFDSQKQFFDINYMMNDVEDLIAETGEGLERVGKIIKGLRTFSRVDNVQEFADYNINEGLENTLIVTRNELKYTSEVDVVFGNVPLIHCIGGEINQTLLNILINAIAAVKERHAPELGRIIIRTYKENDFVCCSIEDNGSGIEASIVKDIFKPFFTTKPVGVGTGLGLSISYDIIVNKHGGKIEVDSIINQGTKMTVKLPMITYKE